MPQSASDKDFNGRWDISVPGQSRAWWLEVRGAGTAQATGSFVGAPGGQVDPIRDLVAADGQLSFSFWRKYRGRDADAERAMWTARIVDGKLEGTMFRERQTPVKWVGVRAPVIADREDGSWREGKPVELFNGKDLAGWTNTQNWEVREGILRNVGRARDIATEGKFCNFSLHVEYRVGEGSNSGVGLRGRYEIQIMDDYGRAIDGHSTGSVYSRILPAVNASKPAKEWQTFDIRLVGLTATIVHNAQKIIDKGEIDGLTAIATDPNEAEPGPIVLQGDHGPVEFRRVVLTPLAR
jgi:hypothetical protein